MNNYFYKNLYEILGIEPTDEEAKIKAAYRAMARKYHPDLHTNDEIFVAKFKEITEAYEILTDKSKKALYDSFKGFNKKENSEETNYSGAARSNQAGRAYKNAANSKTSSGKSETSQSYSSYGHSQEYDQKVKEASTKNSFSEVFNDILEGLFKDKHSKQSTKEQSPRKQAANGTDITSEVTISYMEAITGTHRTVNILHTEVCPNCQGKMFINGAQCPLCKGSGETSIHKKINVKIPKNIKQNAKIRIANEGNRGRNGGKNGDVYLIVKIENDSKYTFDGLNASFEVPIQPHEAVFGTDISVITPQGAVVMKIPANTSSGQKFRLSSHGLKDGSKIGDAIVTVRIDLPRELSDEELALYKKLSEISKSVLREA